MKTFVEQISQTESPPLKLYEIFSHHCGTRRVYENCNIAAFWVLDMHSVCMYIETWRFFMAHYVCDGCDSWMANHIYVESLLVYIISSFKNVTKIRLSILSSQ